MAKSMGVWGIDIGQCALKALRCHLEGETVVADAFDFIEYPKLLSQPDANAPELIKEALEQFLSRNDVIGDKVAISVPGQSGLARYFKPPPVDAKKIADIVKYEARQQIPFPLEDVIWDYQRMGGGTEVDGIALETEVGLFAMKREQVYKALQPFVIAGIEIDVIQLAPLCIYNYVVYDLLEKTLPPPETFDPDAPPPSTVVVSIGTDTTDLVVTNGYRVWQRNIPLGGNHFTKQLTKELKFTFAKAEHIKRNAHQAEDPKQVFQAMRPVFNDMVTELQRSLSFFQNLDRKAHINNVVVMGNTIKLPGLKQYLTKHLGYNVIDFEQFERLDGDGVTKSPAFRDNLLAFGPCYGLCLQGLNHSKLSTNLLPREITTERMVRAKKPWAVAAVAIFLMGCAFNYIFHNIGWRKAHLDDWQASISRVGNVVQTSTNFKTEDDKKKKRLEFITHMGQEVVGNPDRRILWLELTKLIHAALPHTLADPARHNEILDPKKYPFSKQKELRIESIESQYFPDLKLWYDRQGGAVKRNYNDLISEFPPPDAIVVQPAVAPGGANPGVPVAAGSSSVPPGTPTPPATMPPAIPGGSPAAPGAPAAPGSPGTPGATAGVEGPQGPGWVIEIHGHHFYSANTIDTGPNHVRKTLLKNLLYGTVDLPGPNGKDMKFTMKEMGIGFPILATDHDLQKNFKIENRNYDKKISAGGVDGVFPDTTTTKIPDPKDAADNPPFWSVTRYPFVVQFAWKETTLRERLEARAKLEAEQALQTPPAAPTTGTPAAGPPAAPTTTPMSIAPGAPVAPPASGVPSGVAPAAGAPGNDTPPATAPGTEPAAAAPGTPAAAPGNIVPQPATAAPAAAAAPAIGGN